MIRWLAPCLPIYLLLFGASAQDAPIRIQLLLPGFFETPFTGDRSLIEMPERPIGSMKLRLLQSAERNLITGSINVWVNGKGVSNLFDSRNVAGGTEMIMDLSALGDRPNDLFDPRENAVEVMAADNRGRKYYQSWILRTNGPRNPYFAYQGTVSPDDPKGAPPDLSLDSPLAPVVLKPGQSSTRVAVKGNCSSAHPTVLLKIGSQSLRIETQSQDFEQTVEVRPDTKELVVSAVDAKQNTRKIIIPVVLQSNRAAAPRSVGGKYALVIGISHYGGAKGAPPDLPAAAAGAGEVARELEEKAGFRPENIRLLRDEAATQAALRIGLSDFAAKAQADDLLLIYVAGRAMHDPRPGNNAKLYLAPFGTQMNAMESTAISFADLQTWLDRSVRCNHSFVIFDVGHEVTGDWRFPGPSLVNNHLLGLFSEQRGRAILTSGSAGEVSMSRADGQSDFTYWLTRGLRGEADLNQDRVVTGDELFRFVEEKVREDTLGKQSPRFRLPGASAAQPMAELAAK